MKYMHDLQKPKFLPVIKMELYIYILGAYYVHNCSSMIYLS